MWMEWAFNTADRGRQTVMDSLERSPVDLSAGVRFVWICLMMRDGGWKTTVSCWEQTGLTHLFLYMLSPQSFVFPLSGLHSLSCASSYLFRCSLMTRQSGEAWQICKQMTSALTERYTVCLILLTDSSWLSSSIAVWLNLQDISFKTLDSYGAPRLLFTSEGATAGGTCCQVCTPPNHFCCG